jgi:hypothetical protein
LSPWQWLTYYIINFNPSPLPKRSEVGGVDGTAINRWPWRCGVCGLLPPPPPCALVVPLALLSCSIDAVARRTGCVGIFSPSFCVAAEVSSHGNGRIIPPSICSSRTMALSFHLFINCLLTPPPSPPPCFLLCHPLPPIIRHSRHIFSGPALNCQVSNPFF